MDEALKYHWVLEKGEAHGPALKDVRNLSRHGLGDMGDVPSMQSSEVGVSRTHSLWETQQDTGRPLSSKAGSLMGKKWGAGWRARAGARLGKALDAGVPGWRVIRGPSLQCLEQQTEEVGEGVSEIVLVAGEGRQVS